MSNGESMKRVEAVARQRVAGNVEQIRESLRCVREGNPLAAETTERLVGRFIARNQMTRQEAEATVTGIRALTRVSKRERAEIAGEPGIVGGPEAIWGGTIDFVGVAFFEHGRRAARSVARVAFRDGRGQGSGFMVSERLFLTNHHVIPTRAAAAQFCAEFDYELDIRDNPIARTSFAFDPTVFFSDGVGGLDFTLIGIGPRLRGDYAITDYGCCALSDSPDKHAIGEYVNIIQHPRGRYKEVVLRENQIAARADLALHYLADTEPGSSGSPVFNSQWQPVALHHWGGPLRLDRDEDGTALPRTVNEGIRISAIVKALRARSRGMDASTQAAVEAALRQWSAAPTPNERATELGSPSRPSRVTQRVNDDGSTSWMFPIEIRVQAPLLGTEPEPAPGAGTGSNGVAARADAESAVRPSNDFSDRDGYEPGFIPGFVVPLPRLGSDRLRQMAAPNRERRDGRDPFELPYHHFSVVVNANRKLAFFAACNIDGRRSKYINRDTGQIEPLDPTNPDHGLMERIDLGGEAAEASEQWYQDDRILSGQIAGQDTYGQQEVPGFPDTRSMGRTLRMFQRGHLVRRLDPAWGTNDKARLAEADTFFFTNCSPQVGFFNMGRAAPNIPGTGGGKLWRAVENLILRNARNQRGRICAFTGPIFGRHDRPFRNIRVPERFFKIAVWADESGLRSLGMIADQSRVISVWPESVFGEGGGEALDYRRLGAEAFQDPDELERVDDFLTTIARIETDTGLDFGSAVREADVRRGDVETSRPERLEDVPLLPRRSRGSKANNKDEKKEPPRRKGRKRR